MTHDTTLFSRYTIQFHTKEGTTVPDTVEEWDASEWQDKMKTLEGELDDVARRFAEANGLTWRIE